MKQKKYLINFSFKDARDLEEIHHHSNIKLIGTGANKSEATLNAAILLDKLGANDITAWEMKEIKEE